MAKLTGPLMSMTAQKQLGNALIYKMKNNKAFATNYSRPGRKKAFTPSASQITQRKYMQDARDAWATIDQSDRNDWNDFVLPKRG